MTYHPHPDPLLLIGHPLMGTTEPTVRNGHLDDHDRTVLAARVNAYDATPGVRVGDFIEFADGATRRVSELWDGESIQTPLDGRFHLGDYGVSDSGRLFPGVAPGSLSGTGRVRDGYVWFFHHGHRMKDNGVDAVMAFRVFTCSLPAPLC